MSPNSDWNTLHAPISFLPCCLVHFWAACASPTAPRPLDLPSTPRGCPVLLSKHLSCCRTLFCLFSNNHSQASNPSPASHTSQSEIQFFPLVLTASHYLTCMQICHLPQATPHHPGCRSRAAGLWATHVHLKVCFHPLVLPWLLLCIIITDLKCQISREAPQTTQSSAAPLSFSAL